MFPRVAWCKDNICFFQSFPYLSFRSTQRWMAFKIPPRLQVHTITYISLMNGCNDIFWIFSSSALYDFVAVNLYTTFILLLLTTYIDPLLEMFFATRTNRYLCTLRGPVLFTLRGLFEDSTHTFKRYKNLAQHNEQGHRKVMLCRHISCETDIRQPNTPLMVWLCDDSWSKVIYNYPCNIKWNISVSALECSTFSGLEITPR